jgi:uncharacterized protein YceH (UPF0502 family)
LGCLIEKEFTTPDIYPLSLNSLVNACNQRSNRAPVLDITSRDVELALESLRFARLASVVAQADARVMKFRQTLAEVYYLTELQRALLAELLLRGPQTTAELRLRAARMQAMPELAEVEQVVASLVEKEAGELVRKLPRQPGQKEPRWVHLLGGEPVAESVSVATSESSEPGLPEDSAPVGPVERGLAARVDALAAEVATLRADLAALRASLGA